MSHNIKHIFTALDLEVDDLMYDKEKSIMVRVALVGPVTTKTVFESTLFGASSKVVSTRQIVLENTETKELYVITTNGKEGNNLPFDRFKYLIKNQAPITITNPVYPYYPVYPVYPSYPLYPDYPTFPVQPWITYTGISSINVDTSKQDSDTYTYKTPNNATYGTFGNVSDCGTMSGTYTLNGIEKDGSLCFGDSSNITLNSCCKRK